MKKLKDFILLIVLFLSTGVVAQNYTITGKVTESGSNMPIPGASIMIKGTSTGTISDIDGNYTVKNVPKDAELEFSFVGMESQMISVDGRSVINVELLMSTTALDEVVMVGYGIQKKSDLTGASQRLTAQDMETSVATSPIEMMQGRASGVNITQNSGEPGSGMTVRVRGSNSIRSGQEPLYVVDGIPLDNTDITPDGGSAAGYGGGSNKNPISFLNPEDIESIDILKDASSTAIYGARGANGVVIITTKQGKTGQSQLSYSGYLGVSNIRKKLDLVTADEFRTYRTQTGDPLLDEGANTDWQDEIFQSSLTRSHNLSIGGGSDKAVYHASLGYLVQDGIINTTSMEKLNGKLNITHNAFKGRLKLTESLIASRITDSRAPITENEGSGAEGDLLLTALSLNPTYPVLNGDGSYYQKSTLERNPVAMLNLIDDETVTDRILANISANLNITNGLNYKLNVSLDQTNAERRVNQDNDLTYLVDDGEADINSVTATNKLIENYFTYNLKAGKNSLNFLLGHAYQNFQGTTSGMNVTGFEVEDIKYTDNIEYGNFSQATTSSSTYERELQSFFGRINYNYNEKYLITVTGRMDGSSKFGENNKYGFFPSASFAWRLTQEEFLKNTDLLSNLKLRLSYGLT
ncbi:MAG: SusC/RagA family TonB-linked outer membrane protein, partial [Bacteroidales bacterium]|nr:SusC/RagA family TonB-linked outer membrane protein [Bacteroidales bacterium]